MLVNQIEIVRNVIRQLNFTMQSGNLLSIALRKNTIYFKLENFLHLHASF